MKFRASFCDPFKADIIEVGEIEKDKILELFHKTPWMEYLEKMKKSNDKDIHYSPSLEIENLNNKNGLSVSAVDGKEWYIFFKRPKLVKKFFGLIEKMENDYVSEIHNQTEKDVIDCLNALIENNLELLENKIK